MKFVSLTLTLILSFTVCNAQLENFKYLNQPNPIDTPKLFLKGTTERIAISHDNSEIYFDDSTGISYYKYLNGSWSNPLKLINGYGAPSLSNDDTIMYIQDSKSEVWYLSRTLTGWSGPTKFWSNSKSKHYLQITNKGNYYLSYNLEEPVHGAISKLFIHNSDTIAKSLGTPINSGDNGIDFYISRDESYIIFVRHPTGEKGDLYISFHKNDDNWTIPIKLNPLINSSCWESGPYVTPDNKYLFFTRYGGCTNNLSSIYCVRIDKIIATLRQQVINEK